MPFNKEPSRQGDLTHTSHSLPCPGSVFKTSKWENGGTAEIHAAATVLQKAVISHVVFVCSKDAKKWNHAVSYKRSKGVRIEATFIEAPSVLWDGINKSGIARWIKPQTLSSTKAHHQVPQCSHFHRIDQGVSRWNPKKDATNYDTVDGR